MLAPLGAKFVRCTKIQRPSQAKQLGLKGAMNRRLRRSEHLFASALSASLYGPN